MNHIVKQFLEERNAEFLYDDLIDLLCNNESIQRVISDNYERKCREEDVVMELDSMGVDYNDKIVLMLTDIYEDRLLDLEDWHQLLHDVICEYLK